jgi:5-methylcytosine-specific restriction protein B
MMTTKPAEPLGLSESFQRVLEGYARARRGETFGADHPLWGHFRRIAEIINGSGVLGSTGRLRLKWSAGQGRWATVPWISILDARETERITEGFYVAYLFREDMSGMALTLNQGSSDVMMAHKVGAEEVLRRRADLVAAALPTTLASAGWSVGVPLDLRASAKLTRAYNAASAAHQVYARGAVPAQDVLLSDLSTLLAAYQRVVPTSRYTAAR